MSRSQEKIPYILKLGAFFGIGGFMILGLIVVVWAILYFGFYIGYQNFQVKGHQDFTVNGLAHIQPAKEIDEIFEDCRHYIVYSDKDPRSTWNSSAYFGGRYVLTMQVPVDIESELFGVVAGIPNYILNEVTSVSISSSGQVGASFGRQFEFGEKEWQKIYESGGEFEQVGFNLESSPVANFMSYAAASRQSN